MIIDLSPQISPSTAGMPTSAVTLSSGIQPVQSVVTGGSASSNTVFGVVTETQPDGSKKFKVNKGVCYCGSEEVQVEALDIGEKFSGQVYLVVDYSSGFSAELATVKGSGEHTISRLLYDFDKGAVKMDYRMAPVFVLYN